MAIFLAALHMYSHTVCSAVIKFCMLPYIGRYVFVQGQARTPSQGAGPQSIQILGKPLIMCTLFEVE